VNLWANPREHPTGKGDAYDNSPDRAGNRKSTAVGARRSALSSGRGLSAHAACGLRAASWLPTSWPPIEVITPPIST
jgi:hypothetical protein